jgi:hypothetical protein
LFCFQVADGLHSAVPACTERSLSEKLNHAVYLCPSICPQIGRWKFGLQKEKFRSLIIVVFLISTTTTNFKTILFCAQNAVDIMVKGSIEKRSVLKSIDGCFGL